MFLSKKCKNIHRKPISIKKTFIQTEIKEEVKIVTDEKVFEDKEETLTLINEKIEEDSNEETVSEEDLKKKTKKKNNKE
jgi:hypothetical protein